MSAIPGNVDTEQAPPMTVPLRHFVLALGFLVGGAAIGAVGSLSAGAIDPLVHVHLLLVGWVCLTIMGAMTQFVPVWSGAKLHSRRLATAQLWLVAAGLVGFAAALLVGNLRWLPLGGAFVVAGVWVFAYNLGRTLLAVRPWDVTERHFALAIGFFILVTGLGFVLAVGFTRPIIPGEFSRTGVRGAHVTLAVFGAVLTTVFGALYQLATMFTQTELHGIDEHLRRLEEVGYPLGVVALAFGRLFGLPTLARIGGLLVAASVFGFGVLLVRRLYETHVDRTPMLDRYAVVAVGMLLWAVPAAFAWARDPLTSAALYGAPGTVHLLLFGIIGFVVLGTLYHIIPFIVWVHRYSDQLGLADVPMIDDLYDDRLATADLGFFLAGTVTVIAGNAFELPDAVSIGGGLLIFAGSVLFAANMLSVLHRHGTHSIGGVLFDRLATEGSAEPSADDTPPEGSV